MRSLMDDLVRSLGVLEGWENSSRPVASCRFRKIALLEIRTRNASLTDLPPPTTVSRWPPPTNPTISRVSQWTT